MKRCLLAMTILCSAVAWSRPLSATQETTDRFMVRMRPSILAASVGRQAQVQRALKAAASAGVTLTHWRRMGLGAEVLKLAHPVSLAEARKLAERMQLQAGVDWAVPSQRRFAAAKPNDPEFSRNYTLDELTASRGAADAAQILADFGLIGHLWYLDPVQPVGDLKTLAMSINWLPAWERTNGFTDRSYQAVVAVLDTGSLPHADLDATRMLPGYDFINDLPTARDGTHRDANPKDEGDWNSTSECEISDSSWHGTFVAGIIGATANNSESLAGVNPKAHVLPVRVLGKCGGYDEDIIDGALWAAGQNPQYGPAAAIINPAPAQVVNFSLGSAGACTAPYQAMIDQLRSSGVVVIAAAGNDRQNVSRFAPANCAGVISVASTSRAGALADYSNFGAGVSLSAPGGGTTFKVTSLSNAGKTVPGSDSVAQERGTSFSSPMVAAAASLVKAISPALSPDNVSLTLQLSASPFPANIDCDPRVCGTGVLNVDNAARLAAAHLLANPSHLVFYKSASSLPATQTVILRNTGGAAQGLGAPALASYSGAEGDFILSHNCPVMLAPSATCALNLSFTPAASGSRYAWVELAVAGATLRVALSGINSGPVLDAAPSLGLQFAASTGRQSSSQLLTFTNTSTQLLSFEQSAVGVVGPFLLKNINCDGSEVESISDCLLPAAGVLTLSMAYAPTKPGNDQGSLTLKPVEGTEVTLPLQGTASGAGLAMGSGPGGGCTARGGQFDLALLLPALFLRRRRRDVV